MITYEESKGYKELKATALVCLQLMRYRTIWDKQTLWKIKLLPSAGPTEFGADLEKQREVGFL